MKLLAFDTSSRILTVAGMNDQGLVTEVALGGAGFQHAENLFPLIAQVLANLKLDIARLDGYVAGLGPGSFTGLRIGLAALKGFVASRPKPVYGISSLDLIAQGIPAVSPRLGVAVNARRQKIYACFYEARGGAWARLSGEDEILSPAEFAARLGPDAAATGDALNEYGAWLEREHPSVLRLEKDFWYPRATYALRLFSDRYKGVRELAPEEIRPRYLRLSEAEEKVLGSTRLASD
jgi:tRNA threonylcarbamoyladenosine biosynthesis protein TsaB